MHCHRNSEALKARCFPYRLCRSHRRLGRSCGSVLASPLAWGCYWNQDQSEIGRCNFLFVYREIATWPFRRSQSRTHYKFVRGGVIFLASRKLVGDTRHDEWGNDRSGLLCSSDFLGRNEPASFLRSGWCIREQRETEPFGLGILTDNLFFLSVVDAPQVDSESNGSLHRGRFPAIFQIKDQLDIDALVISNDWPRDTYAGSKNPWPLIGFHSVQLSLHDGQLFTENYRTDYSATGDYRGQRDHPSVASIYSVNKSLIGYFCLALVFLGTYFGLFFLLRYDR